mmetsp:Transcript_7107/g.9223  ORF Transcript_7107/g.9223 Transcript_7107/m.9223 type:complete len:491 (+) Transcript_7107:1771-3243(+)|eukprot:CAMPEP_0116075468 /NCGR_PEP_ID=MMETSP0322-20121206/16639_1 /TAXON_ID=163516 /ORGANISM="Leptocylindrus danicus var. apora, Strain B651" /LENGTH=490 /DNA_ID=CAMNT_0003565505 /DNA_START=137 /DNA_END=1609 /DNA_ORIENTATION=+
MSNLEGNSSNNDEGSSDVTILQSNLENPLSVFPHARHDCAIHRYQRAENLREKNIRFCPKCYCFICDKLAANCEEWAKHCQATDKDKYWLHLRTGDNSNLVDLTKDEDGDWIVHRQDQNNVDEQTNEVLSVGDSSVDDVQVIHVQAPHPVGIDDNSIHSFPTSEQWQQCGSISTLGTFCEQARFELERQEPQIIRVNSSLSNNSIPSDLSMLSEVDGCNENDKYSNYTNEVLPLPLANHHIAVNQVPPENFDQLNDTMIDGSIDRSLNSDQQQIGRNQTDTFVSIANKSVSNTFMSANCWRGGRISDQPTLDQNLIASFSSHDFIQTSDTVNAIQSIFPIEVENDRVLSQSNGSGISSSGFCLSPIDKTIQEENICNTHHQALQRVLSHLQHGTIHGEQKVLESSDNLPSSNYNLEPLLTYQFYAPNENDINLSLPECELASKNDVNMATYNMSFVDSNSNPKPGKVYQSQDCFFPISDASKHITDFFQV